MFFILDFNNNESGTDGLIIHARVINIPSWYSHCSKQSICITVDNATHGDSSIMFNCSYVSPNSAQLSDQAIVFWATTKLQRGETNVACMDAFSS